MGQKNRGASVAETRPPLKGLFSGNILVWGGMQIRKFLGMNGVAVARNGPRLWENEATGSRNVFGCLPGLWEALQNLNGCQSPKISKCSKLPYFYITVIYVRASP